MRFDPKLTGTQAEDPRVNPAGATMFVHCKSVVADVGTPAAKAFVGSQNQFLNESLEAILELGTLVTDARTVSTIPSTFETDLGNATQTQASPSPSTS